MSRILVIDDEPSLLEALTMYLERQGFEVETARDGDEGIEVYQQRPADLVVTDILMPQKEGFETIRELKRISPELKIIVISGGGRNAPDIYLKFAHKFGADRAFAKPLDLDKLLAGIKDLLGPAPVE